MRRQFNYTGRKRIPREKIEITLRDQGQDPPAFDARIDLSELALPESAKVYVEAYYRSSYMRFDFGTVANVRCEQDRTLREISNRELIYFRVKIVDFSGEHGKILAEADRIIPNPSDGGGSRMCILETKFEDLGCQAWRLDLDGAMPVLVVNRRLGREYVRSDETFFALVYPAVIREILMEVVKEGGHEPDPYSDNWRDLWLHYICESLGVDPLTPRGHEDDANEWIEQAVRSFCDAMPACRSFLEAHGKDEAS